MLCIFLLHPFIPWSIFQLIGSVLREEKHYMISIPLHNGSVDRGRNRHFNNRSAEITSSIFCGKQHLPSAPLTIHIVNHSFVQHLHRFRVDVNGCLMMWGWTCSFMSARDEIWQLFHSHVDFCNRRSVVNGLDLLSKISGKFILFEQTKECNLGRCIRKDHSCFDLCAISQFHSFCLAICYQDRVNFLL